MTKQLQIAIIVAIVLGIGIIGLRQFNQPDKKIATSKEQVRKSPDVKKSDSASQEPVAIEKTESTTGNQPTNDSSPEPNQPTAINISNWKTYRNETYGFEVKYPDTWEGNLLDQKTERRFLIEKDTPRTIKYVLTKKVPDGQTPKNVSSIVVQFTDWYDITKEYADESDEVIGNAKMKTIEFGGKKALIPEAYYSDFENGCDGHYIMTINPAPKNWGKFNTTILSCRCKDYEEFKKIMETVKID